MERGNLAPRLLGSPAPRHRRDAGGRVWVWLEGLPVPEERLLRIMRRLTEMSPSELSMVDVEELNRILEGPGGAA